MFGWLTGIHCGTAESGRAFRHRQQSELPALLRGGAAAVPAARLAWVGGRDARGPV